MKKCVHITRVSPQSLLKPLKLVFTWKTDVALIPLHCPIWHTVCPCSSFVPGNVGYELLLLASCFPPVLDLFTGLKQQLWGWRCWQLRGGAALIIWFLTWAVNQYMYFSTFQLFVSRRQLPIFLLETWSAGSRRTQFIMICSHRLASPTSSTPARSIFCWLATYTRGSIFSRLWQQASRLLIIVWLLSTAGHWGVWYKDFPF